MTTDNRRHTACTVAISAVVLLALSLMWSAQIAAREIGPESNLCAEINALPPGEELVLARGKAAHPFFADHLIERRHAPRVLSAGHARQHTFVSVKLSSSDSTQPLQAYLVCRMILNGARLIYRFSINEAGHAQRQK